MHLHLSRLNVITRTYLRQSLRFDLVAGLTVAMIVLPQSMAYAAIAGVNPIFGVYTAIVPAVIGALFGSSHLLVTGPTNATALVVVGVLAAMSEQPDYVEFVFIIAILSGVIKLVLGLLRLGGIIRYISNSVLTGFLSAAAILIIVDQFGNLLGIHIPKDQGMVAILLFTAQGLGQINLPTLVVAALSILFMLGLRRLNRKLPAALLAVAFAAFLVQLTGWHAAGVKLVSDMGLPTDPALSLRLPQVPLESLPDLLPAAGAVALFSLMEAMSIAKVLSLASGKRVDPSREFIGQGLASIAGGLTSCIPPSGSPSRSAVNYNTGAKTRLAGAFSGGFVWLTLLIFAGFFGYIPIPGLAAVVVVSAVGLIDRAHIKLTWTTRLISRTVLVVTFLATLLLPLHLAIYLGVLLSIGIHLYESGHLQMSYLVFAENGQIIEKKIGELYADRPEIAVLNIEGDLYFGAVNDLEEAIQNCMKIGVRVLILRLRRMHRIASTGITAFQWSIVAARRAGASVLLSEVTPEIYDTLEDSHICDLIGKENIFPSSEFLFESTRRALAHGKELLQEENTRSGA